MSAIRLLTVAVTVTVITPANAYSIKKHGRIQRSIVLSDPARLVTSPSRPNCPGLARSIDCKTWPPYSEDPDRRDGDGGGG